MTEFETLAEGLTGQAFEEFKEQLRIAPTWALVIAADCIQDEIRRRAS
jgi:hypothetical protein